MLPGNPTPLTLDSFQLEAAIFSAPEHHLRHRGQWEAISYHARERRTPLGATLVGWLVGWLSDHAFFGGMFRSHGKSLKCPTGLPLTASRLGSTRYVGRGVMMLIDFGTLPEIVFVWSCSQKPFIDVWSEITHHDLPINHSEWKPTDHHGYP